MKIVFTFYRSAEWLRAARLESGDNLPDSFSSAIETKDMSAYVRATLLNLHGGTYPDRVEDIKYKRDTFKTFIGQSYGLGTGYVNLRHDGVELTANDLHAVLADALDWIKAEQVKEEKNRAAELLRDQKIAEEWAALPLAERASSNGSGPNYARDENGKLSNCGTVHYPREVLQKHCPQAWQEAVDRSKINSEIAKGKEYHERLQIVSEFLSNVPDDALRGTLKRMASNDAAIEELQAKVEKASTHVVFSDEE